MAFLGVGVFRHSHRITAKLHGRFDDLPTTPQSVREAINNYLGVRTGRFDIVKDAGNLAEHLADAFCDDTILWIEVITHSPDDDVSFCAVREGKISDG